MFSSNQAEILRILALDRDREQSMSELGRLLNKAPGTFQKGLDSLERQGFVASRRAGRERLLSLNGLYPFIDDVVRLASATSGAVPGDLAYNYPKLVREAPGVYGTSQLKILVIAGPNGAGKTTFARQYLLREANCPIFVNADYIAHGLSPFSPSTAAIRAGKLMLSEIREHIGRSKDVALETTLSGRRYARMIPQWQAKGYGVKLIFLDLASVDIAIARVAARVAQGGHSIPEDTIRRRYESGRRNFEHTYKTLVDAWAHYDASGSAPVLMDEGEVQV